MTITENERVKELLKALLDKMIEIYPEEWKEIEPELRAQFPDSELFPDHEKDNH